MDLSSKKRASISPLTANLLEQYGTRLGVPVIPAMEDMEIMWPRFKLVNIF